MNLLGDHLPPPGALPTLDDQMTQASQNDHVALEIYKAFGQEPNVIEQSP